MSSYKPIAERGEPRRIFLPNPYSPADNVVDVLCEAGAGGRHVGVEKLRITVRAFFHVRRIFSRNTPAELRFLRPGRSPVSVVCQRWRA